jgi:serine O-acetyltransferase
MIEGRAGDAVADVTEGVSASVPDWSRERPRRFWDPGRRLLGAIRRYEGAGAGLPGRVLRKLAVLEHRFWSVVTGADIPLGSRIGGGLLLPHPNGVVVHPGASIGPNCLLFQQVTLGAARGGLPMLGGHVDVGAGAKIIGAVRVGDHAVIGANAVVTSDVPPRAVVAGIPARVLRIDRGPDGPYPGGTREEGRT